MSGDWSHRPDGQGWIMKGYIFGSHHHFVDRRTHGREWIFPGRMYKQRRPEIARCVALIQEPVVICQNCSRVHLFLSSGWLLPQVIRLFPRRKWDRHRQLIFLVIFLDYVERGRTSNEYNLRLNIKRVYVYAIMTQSSRVLVNSV